MKKWVCKVCGYIYEGPEAPAECPVCHAKSNMFEEVKGEMKLAAEHEFGVYAKTVKNNDQISEEDKKYIFDQLMANFNGECSEVGMYLCMARIAHREGYPEIGLYWEKAAYEEAEHAAKFAELLGSDLESNMTSPGVWTASSARPTASSSWLPARRRTALTPFTTPSMRWPATRPVTARRSRACWSATSSKPKALKNQEIFKGKLRDRLPLFCSAGEWGVDKKVDVRSCFRQ